MVFLKSFGRGQGEMLLKTADSYAYDLPHWFDEILANGIVFQCVDEGVLG